MMCANNRVHYGLMVLHGYLHITLPHYHHYADLSEGIELLKCLSDILCLERVSKISSVLSIIVHAYIGLCVFSLSISLMTILRIPELDLIIIIKSEVWPICHFLGLGHGTMVSALCLSIFSSALIQSKSLKFIGPGRCGSNLKKCNLQTHITD